MYLAENTEKFKVLVQFTPISIIHTLVRSRFYIYSQTTHHKDEVCALHLL